MCRMLSTNGVLGIELTVDEFVAVKAFSFNESHEFSTRGLQQLRSQSITNLNFQHNLIRLKISFGARRPVILFRLFRLVGVGGCNALRTRALFKHLSFRSPPPLPIFFHINSLSDCSCSIRNFCSN